MESAAFLREKANQCRTLAEGAADQAATARGLLAMALELDAQAVAIEAGQATEREIQSGSDDHAPEGGSNQTH